MTGLVLEGGGTKGAFHTGALRAIEEKGIEISHIAGTSIGAVNGAVYGQGDFEVLEEIWNNIRKEDVFSPVTDGGDEENIYTVLPRIIRQKGLDITPFEKLLKRVIDEDKLRRTGIDFGLVTYCLSTNSGKYLFLEDIERGKLHDFLLAGCAFPGFRRRTVENKTYLDGGVINNLPVDMLVKKGVKDIISVEVGGMGITRKISAAGCNVLTVRPGENIVGLFDFDHERIRCGINAGYFETMKVLGKYAGDKYFFGVSDYYGSLEKYSRNIMDGLEKAADFFGVERYRKYEIDEFVRIVNGHYIDTPKRDDIMQILKWSNSEKVAGLASAIISSDSEILKNRIIADFLGDIFDAASAVAYFNRRKNMC